MNIKPWNFVGNLYYMGVGMLSIFVVIGVIILITMLLDKITESKKDNSNV